MVYNVQVIDMAEVSDEIDTKSQVDQNAILRSNQNLCLKKEQKES